jgi:hypothetical protein
MCSTTISNSSSSTLKRGGTLHDRQKRHETVSSLASHRALRFESLIDGFLPEAEQQHASDMSAFM